MIVGISGASGVIMGYRLLQELRRRGDVETHLIVSEGAERTFSLETDVSMNEVRAAADFVHDNRDVGALVASGSFKTEGMAVVPCSMRTLSGIAHGYDENLLIRAADVCLKERRPVVLVPRETPLNAAHLRNMALACQDGCRILPPMLTFYNRSETLEEQVAHVVGKVLMQFGLTSPSFRPWEGGGVHGG